MKNAFGIITAVIIVAAISGVAALILTISGARVKNSTDAYLQTQAQALSESATEYAIMRIEGFDRSNGGCLESINITAYPFQISVFIKYFMTQATSDATPNCNSKIVSSLTDASANGTVLIDVTVKAADRHTNSQESVAIHKRTIQRP